MATEIRVLICSELSGPITLGVKVASGTEFDLFGVECQPFSVEGRLGIGAENASSLSNIAIRGNIRGWEASSMAPSGNQAR